MGRGAGENRFKVVFAALYLRTTWPPRGCWGCDLLCHLQYYQVAGYKINLAWNGVASRASWEHTSKKVFRHKASLACLVCTLRLYYCGFRPVIDSSLLVSRLLRLSVCLNIIHIHHFFIYINLCVVSLVTIRRPESSGVIVYRKYMVKFQ